MRQPLSGMLDKTRQALQTARLVLDAGDAEGAISRAYYAAFYVASATLWLEDEQPRTHAGVADRFWIRFVQSGRVPAPLGQALRTALEARKRADYDFIGRFDTAAAADLLREVEAFVRAIEALVRDLEAG